MKQLYSALILFFIVSGSYASTISGFVFDKNVNEQLVGATLALQPGPVKTVSMLNGKYLLRNLKAGTYTLKVSYLGYWSIDTTIHLADNENLKLNFALVSNTASLNGATISAKGSKESDRYAKKAEQRADNLVNIVSANSISISPDITVANVMARVSGVSVERGNTGDGQYAIIPGDG